MNKASPAPPRRFSIAHLVLIVPWIALVRDAWEPIRDSSFLWHVRAGDLQIQTGAVLTEDPFSFTMGGESWRTQSWLVELFYGWAEERAGLDFVPPMILVISLTAFVGIGLIAYNKSGSVPATAFVLVLTTFLFISFLVPRPVVFSYALFVLLVLAWERPSSRWAVPFIMWIWASAHGSFALGLVFIGLTIIMRREWRWLPTAILTGLVTLVTAHGLGLIDVLTDFAASREALVYISEWRKPSLLDPVFLPFLGGIVFIVIGAFRGLILPRHVWLLLPFLLLAFTALRSVPPAWIALVPLVALSLSGLTIGSRAGFRRTTAGIFAVAVVVISFVVRLESGIPQDKFPVAALPSLENVPTFHDDRAGGFLIWAEGPERLVYIDDRAELYRDRLGEFVRIRDGDQDWRPVFERDGIEQVLLESEQPLVVDLTAAGWRTVYEDEVYVVLRP